MSEYDARGKVNRALLICVHDYETLTRLPAVEDNAEALRHALTRPGTDLFTADEVVVCRPHRPEDLSTALRTAADEARGLLLVYFSGHGWVGNDGADLQLMVGASDTRQSHTTVSWQDTVLSCLDNARADRVVIVLECCYSGNADSAFHALRKPVSLLMAAQPNRRIFSGEEGAGGTAFTRAVVRILEQGRADRPFVTFDDLAGALRDELADERTPMGEAWEPRAAKQNTLDDVVLSFATPEDRPATPLKIRLRRWSNQHLRRRAKLLIALAAVCALVAAGLVAARVLTPPGPCPPALELRLLTAPEAEPALRRAAFDYEMSPLNTRPLDGEQDLPDGCRRAQITVYSAAKDQIDQGFAAADRWQGEAHGGAPGAPARSTATDPLYRPGPQPDLWIPESTADYEEARRGMPSTGSPATLHDTGPVAYSPLVVGIPAGTQLDGVERVDAPWKDLLTSTDSDHQNLRLLRPSPVLSGTGLLHTLGLYLAGDGAPIGPSGAPDPTRARDAERRLAAPGSQYAGSPELLCSLRQDGGPDQAPERPGNGRSPHSAPLVSEKSLADFNLGHALGSCPALDAPPPLGDRYYAYYPKNVPALDHPLIRVDWAGTADAAPRRAAVARFADWLRDPAGGQRSLTAQGYRGLPEKDGSAPRPDAASPLLNPRADTDPTAPVTRFTAGPDQVAQVLADYNRAQRASRLLILMDTSTSMADGGKLPIVVGAAARALEMVGAHHTYGLWTFPDPAHPGDPAAVRRAVPLGSTDPAPGRAALDRIAKGELVDHGAAMEEALTTAVTEMKKPGEGNSAIVLLIDEDDGGPRRAAGVEQKLTTLLKEAPEVPVLTVVMGRVGCDTFVFQGLARASAGQCVSGGPAAPDLLAGLVASVGTAGTVRR
ncbi:caspase, EACC1-associated type [Streptomyces sp. A1-5]|uniref:caspase, EACC1-associated type n=1 Tax=Streptomyces sp. A1-5 TaxID=2738410 RepID=UPI001F346721|nr:caspase family protein [Streptomyces sp. A1-5]UJB41380.1 substrate-binding domain-containing protein [Streptomyces sp. A1-5]